MENEDPSSLPPASNPLQLLVCISLYRSDAFPFCWCQEVCFGATARHCEKWGSACYSAVHSHSLQMGPRKWLCFWLSYISHIYDIINHIILSCNWKQIQNRESIHCSHQEFLWTAATTWSTSVTQGVNMFIFVVKLDMEVCGDWLMQRPSGVLFLSLFFSAWSAQ